MAPQRGKEQWLFELLGPRIGTTAMSTPPWTTMVTLTYFRHERRVQDGPTRLTGL